MWVGAAKELAAAEYQCSGAESSSDDEDMKPRVSIGSIVTMIPPRLSDSSSSNSGPHSGQQLIVEMTSSSTFQTSELTSDGSRTETEGTLPSFFLFAFAFVFAFAF
jgi:hypothetical protein